MQLRLLKMALLSPQFLLMSIASLTLLTQPAALAVVANMLANGGAVSAPIFSRQIDHGRLRQLMQGIRFLGMPTA